MPIKKTPKPPPAKAAPKKRATRRGTPKGKGTVKRPNGSRIGNPPFVPTEQQRRLVMVLTATGHEQWLIATKIPGADGQPINVKTLQKHFRQDINEAVNFANAELGGVLYKKAAAGDVKALDSWFDRRGGLEWRKKTGLEVAGPDGAPIRHEEMSKPADFSKLPIGKRRMLEKLLTEVEAGQADEPA